MTVRIFNSNICFIIASPLLLSISSIWANYHQPNRVSSRFYGSCALLIMAGRSVSGELNLI
jgi:uncharacterized membrane protein YfhO